MKQSLHLSHSQQLTLTPQLKQSLKLLQLASSELHVEIQNTLDLNPLVELEDETNNSQQLVNATNTALEPVSESDDPCALIEKSDNLEAEQELANILSSVSTEYHTSYNDEASTINRSEHDYEQMISNHESLFDHLYWQIRMTNLSNTDKLIAKTILRSINDEGYLTIRLDEITALLNPVLEVNENDVNAVLSLVKTLDPVGIGAMNLQERLLILLADHNCKSDHKDISNLIIKNHLNLLSSHNFTELQKKLNITSNDLKICLEIITSLEPRITSKFKVDITNQVIPDLVVTKTNGNWQTIINSDNQFKLKINSHYANMLKVSINEQDSKYIQDNLNQAKIFIKALMSRYDTLLLVGKAIVENQQPFFDHGVNEMKPMILNDIAKQLDMHESTISRATSGKYMLTPQGVFELKYFFSSSLSNIDGVASSSTAIRSIIKKMVANESKSKPLSDNKITKELESLGHIIARRTVSKYRESLQIAPAYQRKEF